MRMQVTFWREDFVGTSYDQLLEHLKKLADKGEGFWFIVKARYVRAYITETDYEWIMDNIPNYGFETNN